MAKDVLSRLLGSAGAEATPVDAADALLAKEAPNLYALMTRLVGPSGNGRTPSSLTIFTEDGVWKCCLSERDFGLSLWASSPTFYGLVQAIDGRLGQETVEWRKKGPSSTKAKGAGR